MYNLQVEELEPRQLLSGVRFSSSRPPAHPAADDTGSARVAERSPSTAGDGRRAGPIGPGRPATEDSELGPSQRIVPLSLGGRDPPAPASSGQGGTRIPSQVRVGPAVAGPDSAGTSAANGVLSSASAAAVLPVPTAPVNASPGANAAAAEAVFEIYSERLNPLFLPPPKVRAGATELAVEFASRSAPLGGREGEEMFSVADLLLPPSEPSLLGFTTPPTTVAAHAEPPENKPVLLPEQLPQVLTALPHFALSALERGLQRLLEQMRQMGRRPAREQNATGLGLWVAAVATAALACEIARRHLDRPARRPPRPGKWMPGSLFDPYLSE